MEILYIFLGMRLLPPRAGIMAMFILFYVEEKFYYTPK